jgi:hypothetical protein
LYADIVSRLRARLGLPTTDSAWLDPPEGWPICHRLSRTRGSAPDDWPPAVRVMGCWRPAGPTGWFSRAVHCLLYHDVAATLWITEVRSFRDGIRFSIPGSAER